METNYFFLLDKSRMVNPVNEIMERAPKRLAETITTSKPKVNKRRKADTIPTMVIEEIPDDPEASKPKIVEIDSSPLTGQSTGILENKPVSVVTKPLSGSLSEDRGNPDIKL